MAGFMLENRGGSHGLFHPPLVNTSPAIWSRHLEPFQQPYSSFPGDITQLPMEGFVGNDTMYGNATASIPAMVAPFAERDLDTKSRGEICFVYTDSGSARQMYPDNFYYNVPEINFILEEGERMTNPYKRKEREAAYVIPRLASQRTRFHCGLSNGTSMADDFRSKYAVHGVWDVEAAGKTNAPPSGVLEGKIVNFVVYGETQTFNIFSPRIKKLDRCYFSAKRWPNTSAAFLNPRGHKIGARTESRDIFQVRAWSSSDGPPACNSEHEDEPGEWDSDYIHKDQIMKMEAFRFDTDDQGNVVSLKGDELDIPDVVLDAYTRGHVMNLGVVRIPCLPTDELSIAAAHRSSVAMKSLPRITILMNVSV